MSGNPKECRQHALNCAAELESMESLLGTLRQVKSDGQVKPIDEQKERVGPYGTSIVVMRRSLQDRRGERGHLT